MKSKLLYSLFTVTILALASGCISNKNTPTPTNYPTGTFTGQFRLIRNNLTTGVHDTSSANIQLVLNATTGYSVTGDTSTLQAGSHGAYAINSNYIDFQDATYPKTGTPTKTHLNGIYQYYYDGSSVFQMLTASPLDTLVLEYDLKKTN
ncbi:hypothetical protein JN11_04203 [Mucilaginibacter frigoritolerans]|jgi:hypothetical protein|uniref:Lipoprotein n=1 Tax=Mucilaginibacter frigoritolerans TaxID=652788 RepID=A0A562TRR0_9SPHI|nr:hypothetical protein [Mucilaginibacter frigoritolerans]TWI95928.1 hypothetical protein JN11_04203 [Mucilaginibacter frigoritolerans]